MMATNLETNSTVLDYAGRMRRPFRMFDLFCWLMPLWCSLIIGAIFLPIAPGSDDPFWYAAMWLPVLVAIICARQGRWWMAWYCLTNSVIVLAIAVVLPSLSKWM